MQHNFNGPTGINKSIEACLSINNDTQGVASLLEETL